MRRLKDNLWIWGQPAGSHHKVENNMWKLPGENKMGPLEGAKYLGIPNMCIVTSGDDPAPPFDNLAETLAECPQIAWSIIGDASSTRYKGGKTDLDEVLKVAKKYSNITGAVMDDFLRPERREVFSPEVVGQYADRLHAAGLELWTVIYEFELIEEAIPYLEHCDVITFWTWEGQNLKDIEKNLTRLKSLVKGEKKFLMGCYMWDYGNCKPLALADMEYQWNTYKKLFDVGEIQGVIVCSNCIADIGIEAADYTKKWIEEQLTCC